MISIFLYQKKNNIIKKVQGVYRHKIQYFLRHIKMNISLWKRKISLILKDEEIHHFSKIKNSSLKEPLFLLIQYCFSMFCWSNLWKPMRNILKDHCQIMPRVRCTLLLIFVLIMMLTLYFIFLKKLLLAYQLKVEYAIIIPRKGWSLR